MNLKELEVGRLDELPDRKGKIFLTEVAKIYGEMFGFDAEAWIDDPDQNKWEAVYLDPSGRGHGMSEMDAFRCLVDFPRTLKLMRGIAQEVKEIKMERDDVVAIDAGTGTGILAITMALAGCSRVYALEINEKSAILAASMVREFGLEDKIQVIRCDATKIALPERVHVLVSENLSNGLLDEPQYEIISHLSRFMERGSRVIPGRAILKASLARVNWGSVGRDWEIAKRMIDPNKLDRQVFAVVDSLWGQKIDRVGGGVDLNWNGVGEANALVISTDFVIDGQNRNVLGADEANFLGASTAYRLNGGVSGQVRVDFDYATGVRSDNVKVKLNGGRIKFSTK